MDSIKDVSRQYPCLGALLITGLLIAAPGAAHAFAEDVCYVYRDSGVLNDEERLLPAPFNCYDLTCSDGPGRSGEGFSCVVAGLTEYAASLFLQRNLRGRNSLHFDVVWLLARAAGLTSDEAMTVATYSEATDLGVYQHYDYRGEPLPDSKTDDISGVTRTNTVTAGFWLHFPPWYRATGDTETQQTLAYNFTHASGSSPLADWEVSLNHLRSWAFGQRSTVCNFGLTDANGDCFVTAPDTAGTTIAVSFPIVTTVAQEGTITLVRQVISPCPDGTTDCANTDYDVNNAGSFKALGIYLHSLGDRLSHVQCTDVSYIEPTTDPQATTDYELFYSPSCGQVAHLAMHYRETGHRPIPERSVKAVQYFGAEINDWVTATGYQPGPWAVQGSAANSTLWDRIAKDALPETCAADRIRTLCEIAADYGLGWHDNNPTCQYRRDSCNAD